MPKCIWPYYDRDKKIGRVSQEFGVYNPGYLPFGFTHHNGKDIHSHDEKNKRDGYPIALQSGKVVHIGFDVGGYGNYLIIDDRYNGGTWLYAHLKTIDVAIGQYVESGYLGATTGSTGNSTGPHLHLEWRPDNYKIHLNNGTLGREDFGFMLKQYQEEEMSPELVADFRRRLHRIDGDYIKVINSKGEIAQFDKHGKQIIRFSTPEKLFEQGWRMEDVDYGANWQYAYNEVI